MTLSPITHPSLTAAHGFFTRKGGVSHGLYKDLNCGRGSQDAPENVAQNRGRITAHLGVAPDRLASVYQCHSADVVTVDAPFDTPPQADALVTATPGLALGILTADCAPILFCDSKNSVIAAAHSGWKGTLGGIGPATVAAMLAAGAERDQIQAVIGPTISQRNYEVSAEFLDSFAAEDQENLRFFAQGAAPDKYQFDLPSFILAALRGAGISAAWTGHCTYADADQFFSYRRATHRREPDYGRMMAAIRL